MCCSIVAPHDSALGTVSVAKLIFICGGYGMFLVGMIGSAVYLLINEPLGSK